MSQKKRDGLTKLSEVSEGGRKVTQCLCATDFCSGPNVAVSRSDFVCFHPIYLTMSILLSTKLWITKLRNCSDITILSFRFGNGQGQFSHWLKFWSIGPLVHLSIGPWSLGPLVPWSIGSLVYWSIGPLVHWYIGLLVHWYIGLLVHWYIGPLVHWTTGPLVHWTIGPFVHWSIGPLVHWSIGPLVH